MSLNLQKLGGQTQTENPRVTSSSLVPGIAKPSQS